MSESSLARPSRVTRRCNAAGGSATLGSAILTTGNDNSSTTFSGAISGSGGLTKIGTGALTLTGVSSYTGPTNVNAGTLVVNDALASNVFVNSGGTLKGTGSIGSLTVGNGGALPPGNSIGTLTVQGNLVMATADTATGASERASYTAFRSLMRDWEMRVRRWRCGLSEGERQRLGTPPGWRCNDITVHVERVGFDHLDRERAEVLNAIPTRFQLPEASVDTLIEAGAEVVRNNPTFQAFRRGL